MRFIPFTYIRTNSPVFTMVGNYTKNGGGTPLSDIQLKDYTFGITPNFQTDCSQTVSFAGGGGNTPIFRPSLCYNGTSATVTRTIKNNGVGKVYQISNSTLSSAYTPIGGTSQYYSGSTISDVITLNYNDTITQSITVPIFYGTNYIRITVNWDDTITLI